MKIFLDSSFIIELLKNNEVAVSISKLLLNLSYLELHYNHIVFSEVVYQLYFKRKINIDLLKDIMSDFELLDMNSEIKEIALNFIQTYNLKPNDALILATCKFHKIENLISLDEDFKIPCEKEKINLIDSDKKLERLI